MVPVAGCLATLRVHEWRHGIDIGVDQRPLPGPGEGCGFKPVGQPPGGV